MKILAFVIALILFAGFGIKHFAIPSRPPVYRAKIPVACSYDEGEHLSCLAIAWNQPESYETGIYSLAWGRNAHASGNCSIAITDWHIVEVLTAQEIRQIIPLLGAMIEHCPYDGRRTILARLLVNHLHLLQRGRQIDQQERWENFGSHREAERK